MFTTAVRGSYPRNPEHPRPSLILRALEGWQSGIVSDSDLERAFQRGMVEVMAEQVAAGIEVVNEGQVRWDGPAEFICRRLGGFESPPDKLLEPWQPMSGGGNGKKTIANSALPVSRAIDKIVWRRPVLIDDYKFLQERAPVDIRPALTGPYSLARFIEPGVYIDTPNLLMKDIAYALNRELEGLANAGVKFILIEEPLLSDDSNFTDDDFQAYTILCDNIKASLFIAPGGSIQGFAEFLEKSPFNGFALDILDSPSNAELLSQHGIFPGRIIELGLVNGRNRRIESAMEVGMGLLKYAACRDPNLIWASPSCSMGSLPRDCAFDKLTNLCQGVNWARRELAKSETPGSSN